MKVLFLNTHKQRIDAATLKRLGRAPDVIILAELLHGTQRHYEKALKEIGYSHVSRSTLHSRKRHVRLYSKMALESDDRFTTAGNKLKNNWIWCRVDGLLIPGVHLPTKSMKRRPFEQLARWIKQNVTGATLLIGDFNTTCEDEKWGPQLLEWERLGWRNLWNHVRGGKHAWTFKGNRKMDTRRRIDHAFVSLGIRKASLTHLPAFRELNLTDHSGLLVEIT